MCHIYQSFLKEAERRHLDTSALPPRDCIYAVACTQNGLDCALTKKLEVPDGHQRIIQFGHRLQITDVIALNGITKWLALHLAQT